MRLVLHAGLPKTGTSALQGAFAGAREELAAAGVAYARAAANRAGVNHNPLAVRVNACKAGAAAFGRVMPPELIAELSEMRRSGARTAVLSAEEMSNIFGNARNRAAMEAMLAEGLTLADEVEIFMVWRALPAFFESMYLQNVKLLSLQDPETPFPAYVRGRRRYVLTLIETLNRLAGRDRIRVTLSDQSGGPFDAAHVFAEALGAPVPPPAPEASRNPRPTRKRLAAFGALGLAARDLGLGAEARRWLADAVHRFAPPGDPGEPARVGSVRALAEADRISVAAPDGPAARQIRAALFVRWTPDRAPPTAAMGPEDWEAMADHVDRRRARIAPAVAEAWDAARPRLPDAHQRYQAFLNERLHA